MWWSAVSQLHIDGLMQERRNSIANALELRLSYVFLSFFYLYDLSILTAWLYLGDNIPTSQVTGCNCYVPSIAHQDLYLYFFFFFFFFLFNKQ